MKYKHSYWILIKPFIGKYLKRHFDKKSIKVIFKNAKAEYKLLLSKAEDIGTNNPMAKNLYLSLLIVSFFIANKNKITKNMLAEMIESIFDSSFIKKLIRFDFNNEKDMMKFKNRMLKNYEWAEKHKDKYPETWDFNFENKHKDGCYYYFTRCPIAKFFKDNNMEDLTHLFCAVDYKTFGIGKGRLIRKQTIANGDGICDFWIVGDKVQNPE